MWFNYSHNANDEINSGDGFTFSNYNNNGSPGTISQSGGPTLTLTYNQENRLKKITYSNGAPQNEFLYSGDGLRVQKKVGTGTPTVFIYDGSTVIAEATPSGTITAWYLPGISEYRPGSSFTGYYRENGIGSTLELRNAGGGLESKYLYDAYGVTYAQQQNQSTPYRFVGRHGYYSEDESGLVLLGARYYMPKLGRFLTQDPIGHEAGLNLYWYTRCNPLGAVDPTGTRDLTKDDVRRLHSLYNWVGTAGVTESVVNRSVAHLKAEIASVPQGSPDPARLQALWWAIDRLGNTSYGVAGTLTSDYLRDLGPGKWKCNYFVAIAYAEGAGIGWDGETGVPTNTRWRVNRYPFGANELATSAVVVPNFSVTMRYRSGDIAAFHNPGGLGHSALLIAPGLYIYAGQSYVQLGASTHLSSGLNYDRVIRRTYAPGG